MPNAEHWPVQCTQPGSVKAESAHSPVEGVAGAGVAGVAGAAVAGVAGVAGAAVAGSGSGSGSGVADVAEEGTAGVALDVGHCAFSHSQPGIEWTSPFEHSQWMYLGSPQHWFVPTLLEQIAEH